MALLSLEEIKKLATISRLEIKDEELESLREHIDSVLGYALRVKDIATNVSIERDKNVNVMRDDVVIRTEPEVILKQAPEREENFFVVPTIIDKK